ncbi:metal-dependent hydrolase, partial [Clostridium perfringens]|uniref:metal-dependent hydrolase n=1 Tax=Clostridium perfringens TaxID=1502 RepID=UPI0013E33A7E
SKHLGSKCRHRGFTHSLLCLSLLVVTLYIILNISNFNIIFLIIAIGFIAGYISHLTLDFLTSEGIELFYPWKANFKIAKIKTGSKTEKIINKILKIFNFLLILYNITLILSDILGINILSFLDKSALF